MPLERSHRIHSKFFQLKEQFKCLETAVPTLPGPETGALFSRELDSASTGRMWELGWMDRATMIVYG